MFGSKFQLSNISVLATSISTFTLTFVHAGDILMCMLHASRRSLFLMLIGDIDMIINFIPYIAFSNEKCIALFFFFSSLA